MYINLKIYLPRRGTGKCMITRNRKKQLREF